MATPLKATRRMPFDRGTAVSRPATAADSEINSATAGIGAQTTKPRRSRLSNTVATKLAGLGPLLRISQSPPVKDEATERRLREAIQKIDEELEASAPTDSKPNNLTQSLATAALALITGVFGLYIFSQVVGIIAALNALPTPLMYCGLTVLFAMVAAVSVAVVKAARAYLRLEPANRFKLSDIRSLKDRDNLKRLAQSHDAEARNRLDDYLRSYPIKRLSAKAGNWQLDPAVLDAMRRARTSLCATDAPTDPDQWISHLSNDFLKHLDTLAANRVTYYSNRMAVVSFASPNALLDSLSATYCAFMMVSDLCQVYNLRVGRVGTGQLLARAFFNVYLAGQMGDLESAGTAAFAEAVKQTGLHLGSVAMDSVVAHATGKITMRLTTAALNKILINRLGKFTISLLHPIKT